MKSPQKTANNAIELPCNTVCAGIHTPRACLLRAVSILLSCAPDRDWYPEEEMKGWSAGVRSCHHTVRVERHGLMREISPRVMVSYLFVTETVALR